MNKRFSFYLIREILPLYAAGFTALLILLLGAYLLDILAGAISRGVSPALVAEFLLYSLPSAAGMGIPLALLFAALLGVTRLNQDSEIKAGLLLGLSPRQFLIPLLLLGLAVSAVSFINNELVVPWSDQRAQEVQKDILIQSPQALVEAGNFFTDALGRSVYIEALEPGGNVRGVTVIQPENSLGPEEVIRAERGVLDEEAGVWRLEGIRFVKYRQGQPILDAPAQTATLPVRNLATSNAETPDLTKLPMGELLTRLRNGGGFRQSAEWTALHRKFAEPLAATAFAVFALAIGLYSFRRNFGLGLVSVLFLTFIYYAVWSVSKLLGAQGTIPAYVAGWLPVALYAAAASVLLALSWRR